MEKSHIIVLLLLYPHIALNSNTFLYRVKTKFLQHDAIIHTSLVSMVTPKPCDGHFNVLEMDSISTDSVKEGLLTLHGKGCVLYRSVNDRIHTVYLYITVLFECSKAIYSH